MLNVISITGSLAFIVLLVYYGLRKASRSYPPGPKPLPLLGNMFDIPSTIPWITYSKWRRIYGDIIHVQALGQHVVIINSLKVATELLDKRSKIYSDRPVIPTTSLFGWDFNTVLIPYDEKWKAHRRLFHQSFRPQAALLYRPVQLMKIHDYMRGLVHSPQNFQALTRNLSTAIIMRIVYGYDTAPENDRFVDIAEKAIISVADAMLPGASLVNVFPLLAHIPEWFPGASFQRLGGMCRQLTQEMQEAPLEFVKKNMASGTGNPCMVSGLLEDGVMKGTPHEREQLIKVVATSAYANAADTTIATKLWAILAMVLYPNVVQKAQAEIDAVVGTSRLPNFDDRPSLPYIEAFYREVMRWHPAASLGIPHLATEDDIFEGYHIPKGTIVMSNIWEIARDERIYVDPEKFNPDRFFTESGKLKKDEAIVAYGFGRRICAGLHIADANLWATIVSLLAAFDITKAKDENGVEIHVEEKSTEALISHPLPFKCTIKPRSEAALKLILDTAL